MQDTITVRPAYPKSVLKKIAGGNINRWVNGLIAEAVESQKNGWEDFAAKPRRQARDASDEIRRASR